MSFSTSEIHIEQIKKLTYPLGFTEDKPFEEQRDAIEAKFRELLGMPEKRTDPKPIIEYESTEDDRFDEIRFKFESEPDFFVPCHMLLPKNRTGKLPAVICLQGHSTGMHISLGRIKFDGDEKTISGGDRDFALQAVKRGYAAIAMEQRGRGELKPTIGESENCMHVALSAMQLGRTVLGERSSDVSRLIDALSGFDMIDLDRIGLMGNSGGGTTTYQAACVDKRVKVAMPSCAFNTFEGSIMARHHCICNYIPGILKWFEQPDEAIMIAPRPLIIVAGEKDTGFPIEFVRRGFEKVKKIYEAAGAPDNCKLLVAEGGHRFYADMSWPVFDEFI